MLKIEEVRKSKGITKQHIIKELGITYETLRRWSNGKTDPPFTQMVKLAQILGVDLKDLY